MNIYKTELFPYIIGDSLQGKSVTLTVKGLAVEKLPTNKGKEETRYVLYFEETQKGLILNKTNAKTIAVMYGSETDDWTGKRIAIHPEQVKAFGETHNTVRIDPKRPNGNGKKATAAPVETIQDDELPNFSGK